MSARDLIGLAAIVGTGWGAWRLYQGQSATQGGQDAPQIIPASYVDQAKADALTPQNAAPQRKAGPFGGLDPLALISGLIGAFSGPSQTVQGDAPGQSTQTAPQGAYLQNGGLIMSNTKTSNVAGLLDLIGHAEGAGYNTIYGGSKLQPPAPLTQLTVAQVMDWQAASVHAGSYSSAAGKYQIIAPTLQTLVAQGVVSPNDRFDAATQDKAGNALLERRGLSQYQAGKISQTQFADNLAHEWASFPMFSGPKAGKSAYGSDGVNKSRVSVSRVRTTLTQV